MTTHRKVYMLDKKSIEKIRHVAYVMKSKNNSDAVMHMINDFDSSEYEEKKYD